MKVAGVLEGNCASIVDLRETLDDAEFFKLCSDLFRTYGFIHDHQKWSCEMKKDFLVGFKDDNSSIHTPADLVQFLDYATYKLKDNSCEESILLSKFDDTLLLCDI